MKIEINTREIEAFDGPVALPLDIENPWFSGETAIPTFSRKQLLVTKLHARLQSDKGRDLCDLAPAQEVFEGLNVDRIVQMLGHYLDLSGQTISPTQAQGRMFAELVILLDMRPLLPTARAEALTMSPGRSVGTSSCSTHSIADIGF